MRIAFIGHGNVGGALAEFEVMDHPTFERDGCVRYARRLDLDARRLADNA